MKETKIELETANAAFANELAEVLKRHKVPYNITLTLSDTSNGTGKLTPSEAGRLGALKRHQNAKKRSHKKKIVPVSTTIDDKPTELAGARRRMSPEDLQERITAYQTTDSDDAAVEQLHSKGHVVTVPAFKQWRVKQGFKPKHPKV